MPTERRIQVEVEGKKIEVAVPDGFVHQDDLKETHMPKDTFLGEVQRRVESLTKELRKPEDLIGDATFFETFVEKRKDDLVKKLNVTVKKDEVDIGKIQVEAMDKVRREEIDPLQKGIKTRDEEIGVLRVRDLEAQVSDAALHLNVVPDLIDLVKLHVRKQAEWDGERKQWFIQKPDKSGFELSSDPKAGGHPYEGVREFMEKLSRDTSKKAWFNTAIQAGGNYRGTEGDQTRNITLERYEKMTSTEQTDWARQFPTEFGKLMAEKQTAGEQKLFKR